MVGWVAGWSVGRVAGTVPRTSPYSYLCTYKKYKYIDKKRYANAHSSVKAQNLASVSRYDYFSLSLNNLIENTLR